MKPQYADESAGYSPPIKIELLLHGESFNVASVGSKWAILRNAHPAKPGSGVVRIDVDGNVAEYKVDLFNGIDPKQERQPFVLLGVQSEAAA